LQVYTSLVWNSSIEILKILEKNGGIHMSIYAFQAELSNGDNISLEDFKGKVLLIVNTESKCGLTPQYESLEKVFRTHKDQGFSVLAFPCNQFGGQEPGTDEEIQTFCSVNYDVSFPVFKKIDVNGEHAHPLYRYLREQAPEDSNIDTDSRLYQHLRNNFPQILESADIKWNFTKFLIDQNGNVVKRYFPSTLPEEIENEIEKLLK
jgi:glutathione peroxidase